MDTISGKWRTNWRYSELRGVLGINSGLLASLAGMSGRGRARNYLSDAEKVGSQFRTAEKRWEIIRNEESVGNYLRIAESVGMYIRDSSELIFRVCRTLGMISGMRRSVGRYS